MSTLALIVLLAALVVVAGGLAFAVALARRSKAQLAANLEVVPGMPSGAPAEWAGAHTPEAKLHRRLVALARTVAALPLGDAAAIEGGVAITHRIQELDGRLIAVAAGPEQSRREVVAELEPEVAAAESHVTALAKEPPLV
jgi:hypothetical protein